MILVVQRFSEPSVSTRDALTSRDTPAADVTHFTQEVKAHYKKDAIFKLHILFYGYMYMYVQYIVVYTIFANVKDVRFFYFKGGRIVHN